MFYREHGGFVEGSVETLGDLEQLLNGMSGLRIFLLVASVEEFLVEVGSGLDQSSQLQQIDKVEILQSLWSLALGRLSAEPPFEHIHVPIPTSLPESSWCCNKSTATK